MIPYYEAQAGLGEYFAQTSGLGSAMQTGPGHNFREGVLGSVLQSGAGRSYREGSLGAMASFTNENMLAIAAGAIVAFVLVKKKVVTAGPGFLGLKLGK